MANMTPSITFWEGCGFDTTAWEINEPGNCGLAIENTRRYSSTSEPRFLSKRRIKHSQASCNIPHHALDELRGDHNASGHSV